MGTQTDVNGGDLRWLSPLPLWTGILAGPVAWSLDLLVSYALVKWACSAQRDAVLRLITPVSLAMVCAGAVLSWLALQRTTADVPIDGGRDRQRARFMAWLGLASSALFVVAILGLAIPRWVLDACQ